MALKLEKWIGQRNICDAFTDDQLKQLGQQVIDDWQLDLVSRSGWESSTKAGLDLAIQLAEEKDYPWPGAANVKYPLIAYAAIQFHARAYPEIIRGNDVVKAKVVGKDPTGEKAKRGERISKHMSYQLLEEMEEWEEDTDRMLLMLPIIGSMFKKTYFCPIRQRNVSCLRPPLAIVVNNSAKSIDDARRVTDQEIWLHRNDIFERKAEGVFADVEISYEFDEDKNELEQFLEQHMWYDLDKDGYQEPYIVTVHRHSATVVRVCPRYDLESVITNESGKLFRIEPTRYFTKYSFLPSFDGTFYDLGFGQLLMPLNESINTVLNQLLDAGHLANTQCGLISRGIKIKGGRYQFQPGEFKQVDASPQDIRDGLHLIPFKEPSMVLFQLLSLLVDAGKQLSSVADIMSGEQAGPNEPVGTMLARLEQGLKVFSGIHKRIYRSAKSEYKKLAKLNKDYMDDEYYFRVLDIEHVAIRADYNSKDCDVVPVADPAQGTDMQRMAKARALMEVSKAPGVDAWEVTRNYLEVIKVENIDKIQPQEGKESSKQQPPDPKVIELQMKGEAQKMDYALKSERQEKELELLEAQIVETRTSAVLKSAQAEAAELGPQLEYYKQFVASLQTELETYKNPPKAEVMPNGGETDESGIPGMEEPNSNGAGVQLPQELPEGLGAEIDNEGNGGADVQGNLI